jgi:hypothetical protein
MRKRTLLVEIDVSSVTSSDKSFEVVSRAFGVSGEWTLTQDDLSNVWIS